MHLFHCHSYGHVGVQALCQQAGVRKGSFYHFFDSKQELTLAALDETAKRVREKLLLPVLDDDGPVMTRIASVMTHMFHIQQEQICEHGKVLGCPIGNLALELSTLEEDVRKHISRLLESLTQFLETLLETAIEKQEIPSDTDTHTSAVAMVAYMQGAQLLAKLHNQPELTEQLQQAIPNLLIPHTPS